MLNVDNKFEIGQEVYTIAMLPTEHICPVCDGKGSFVHNGHEVNCPKCNNGKLFDSKNRIYKVIGKYTISGIRIKTYSELNGIKCNVGYIVGEYKRPEERLFATYEEAELACDRLNKN